MVELASDVSLEAADDLFPGESFFGAAFDVVAGPGVETHADEDDYHEEVTIEVPRGFEVVSCDQTTDRKCTAEPNQGSPAAGQAHGGTVTFTRVTKEGTSEDHLSFTVHTPTHKGTYSFPTTQKLSDGDEIEWKGDGVTSENPAPTVRVVDEEAEGAEGGHETR